MQISLRKVKVLLRGVLFYLTHNHTHSLYCSQFSYFILFSFDYFFTNFLFILFISKTHNSCIIPLLWVGYLSSRVAMMVLSYDNIAHIWLIFDILIYNLIPYILFCNYIYTLYNRDAKKLHYII